MRNPFEDLGKVRPTNPQGEEVGGVFSCQEPGCYEKALVARYLRENELLTWKCKDEHISKIVGFQL